MAGGKMREIKRRIKSVKSTHQITKAMEMVSSAKFKKFQTLVLNSRPYSDGIEGILSNIAYGIKNQHHPLFEGKSEVKRIGIIAVTSDRGLCGGYNNNIIKEVKKIEEKYSDKEVSIIAVGKKIRDYVKKEKIDLKAEYIQLVPEMMFEKSKEISENIVEFFNEGIFDEVYIVYSKFLSAMNSEVTTTRLLPLEEVEVEAKTDYIFEPSEEAIMDTLLPKYLNIYIYQSILESTASEHSARMRAMKSASDNADDMVGKLTLLFNRARQASITQELSEIVAGADSIK